MAEASDCEDKRGFREYLLALLDDGLREAGVFLFAGDFGDAVGDGAGPLARRELREVRLPTRGLRDDGAGDTHHVAVLQVGLRRDEFGDLVAAADFRQPRDCEDLHTPSVDAMGKRTPLVTTRRGTGNRCRYSVYSSTVISRSPSPTAAVNIVAPADGATMLTAAVEDGDLEITVGEYTE